jgi:general secretion pathway protein A
MTMELRKILGFHTTPFTREIRAQDLLRFPFFDEAAGAIKSCLEIRMAAALIAPAGTGKTALVRYVESLLSEARYRVTYIKVTDLGKRDLCRDIAVACDLGKPAATYPALVRQIQERFESQYATDGVRPILLIDESQDFRPDVLGMFRILTNFDRDSKLVLGLLLAGKPPLRKLFAREDQEAMARRIYHYATLRLLSREETLKYIEHRCALAGCTTVPFDEAALEALFEISRGNLRAIDQLALKALEHAARDQKKVVATAHITLARRDQCMQ